MAIYHVKGPDGIEHELEGPEGATDEQVIAKAKEAFAGRSDDELATRIRNEDKGLQDVSIKDAVASPFMAADAAGEMTANGLGKAGHPIAGATVGTALQMAPYIPAAVSGIRAAGPIGDAVMGKAGSIREGLADWFKKKAEEQAIKSAAPTGTNLEQLGGPDAARSAGRYMLDKGVVTPGASTEEMLKRVEPLNDAAGKAVGGFRDTGDLRSLAQGVERPSTLDIENAIREKLQGKYGPGAEAGQAGELENAINEIRKLSPVNNSTAGEETAQAMENTGLESDPYYYPQKMESADAYTATRHQDELANLLPHREAVKPGLQTGPQAYSPGSPIPKGLNDPLPVESTPYLHDQPTYSELADKATRLNDVAKNARQLNQPSGAMTDAANVLSQKSTEGLEGLLNPEEQKLFGAAKQEYGTTSKISDILDRSQNRDLANGTSLPVSHFGAMSKGVNAVVPASTRATIADKLANALRIDPNSFGRSGQALQRAMQAGKASLNSTIYMLQQQDPEFKAKYEALNNQ